MPTARFLTPKLGALQLLKSKPALHFAGKTTQDWQRWRREFRTRLLQLMGPRPTAAPLRVEVVQREKGDGYTREKILFNSDPFSTVSAYVLIPDDIGKGERRPGVLCAHGHGNGKSDAAGVTSSIDSAGVDTYKQVAVELCRAGFVVIAPDWRSFGERRDDHAYLHHWGEEHGRDGCDLSYMLYGYFGYQPLTLNVCDAFRCLDYLQSRKDVDGNRLGMIGCSFGGTMTMYTTALEPRIKAAVITCYLSTIGDALSDRGGGNTCGSQFLAGLRAIGDISDVAGLIAPRPCLVQIGSRDTIFVESDALKAYRHLQSIYRAADAAKQLELDHFEGVHEHNVAPATGFLRRHLFSR